jgi:hypothetical protein
MRHLAVGSRVLDPDTERGRHSVHLAAGGPDRLALVQHQSDGPFLELVRRTVAGLAGRQDLIPFWTPYPRRKMSTESDLCQMP